MRDGMDTWLQDWERHGFVFLQMTGFSVMNIVNCIVFIEEGDQLPADDCKLEPKQAMEGKVCPHSRQLGIECADGDHKGPSVDQNTNLPISPA